MAQLLVRKLDDDVKERLRRRAKKHGRSLEEEVREILSSAAMDKRVGIPLGTRIASRFAGLGFNGEIEELRGQRPQPARFRK
ncbi:MAG: toxin-antitoxin system [Proteobacteria bacterium]|nr:toxin-antitoxin system [Pseudomonadota bacterium]MBI3499132.1 toxin-antitoxin system [Pseudomonadota bacterium]